MATGSFLRTVLRLAGIALFVSAVAVSPATLPAVSLHASGSAADAAPAVDAGPIAYVKRSTQDIRLINPDGTNDRLLWTSPDVLYIARDLAWRPDGGELAFTSEHEYTCSYYQTDIYGIQPDGTGCRRITNAPACAALAALPKGAVTVNATSYTGSPNTWVYVAGAPGIQQVVNGVMTFNNVADFGAGIGQPAIGLYVGIYGEERTMQTGTPADVQPGQTVPGGGVSIYNGSGLVGFGAGEVSWKADGSALAYALRTRAELRQLSATPPYGAVGDLLPIYPNTVVSLVAMGPASKSTQYLYVTGYTSPDEALEGIYLNTVGDPSGGEMLVDIDGYYNAEEVWDVEWLPDGSGFLFTKFYSYLGFYSNIYRYDFATGDITQLTDLEVDRDYARGMSISPDGQSVVFERTDQLDTAGSLWILDLNTLAVRKLADDAARPAWGPSQSAAVAPTVSISLSGKNITLTWTDNSANTGGYKVRYSEKPYFQPGDTGVTTVSLPQGSASWTHTNGAGDPAHNYYYLVQGATAGGSLSAPGNRTGGFNYGLTRGTG